MGLFKDIIGTVTGRGASRAAQQAAGVQVAAAGVSQEQLKPFREAGLSALEQQQALLGLSGTEAQQAAFGGLQESPGQQFLRQRQERALLRNQAAIGGLGGGNIRTALQQQAAGFGREDVQSQLAQLSGLSGAGQRAAGSIGQFGMQGAQAQASGILGAQQGRQQGITNLIELGSGLLSDEKAKQNIQDMTPEDCMRTVLSLDIKAWEYLPQFNLGDAMQIGPMAQNSPECIKMEGKEMLDLHSELMLIAGAMQYLKQEGLIQCH